MISITNKIKLKRNVKVSKKDGKTVVSNETDKKGFIVFAKIIYCKKKIFFVEKKITFHLLPRAVRTARLSAIP